MAEDARGLGADDIEADLCIIGAGAAGITLASKFANTKVRVLLLESGGPGIARSSEKLNANASVTGMNYPLSASRLRFIGGTTNHWSGNCYRFVERDFAAKPGVPLSGWPIGLSDVAPYMSEASQLALFRDTPPDWDPQGWSKRLDAQPWAFASDKFGKRLTYLAPVNKKTGNRTFAAYLPRFEKAQNIRFLDNANVVELVSGNGGATVQSARIRTLGGNEFNVRAKTFVLATGGIENARVLLASRKGAANGLGNGHDQVGRYFADHVVISQYFVRNPAVPLDRLLARKVFDADNNPFAHLTLSDKVFREEGMDDVFLRFDPIKEELTPGAEAAVHLKEGLTGQGRISQDDIVTAISHPLQAGGFAAQRAYCRDGDLAFEIAARLVPRAVPESRVTLTDRVDEVGMPTANLHWDVANEGKRSIRRAFELFGQEVGRLNIGRLRLTFDTADPWPKFPEMSVGFHHTCTTRMSDDPRFGVVDKNCRVHGMDNLYVAGSSVFSTAGSGSPTMMLVALTLRLADHLKAERFA